MGGEPILGPHTRCRQTMADAGLPEPVGQRGGQLLVAAKDGGPLGKRDVDGHHHRPVTRMRTPLPTGRPLCSCRPVGHGRPSRFGTSFYMRVAGLPASGPPACPLGRA